METGLALALPQTHSLASVLRARDGVFRERPQVHLPSFSLLTTRDGGSLCEGTLPLGGRLEGQQKLFGFCSSWTYCKARHSPRVSPHVKVAGPARAGSLLEVGGVN